MQVYKIRKEAGMAVPQSTVPHKSRKKLFAIWGEALAYDANTHRTESRLEKAKLNERTQKLLIFFCFRMHPSDLAEEV